MNKRFNYKQLSESIEKCTSMDELKKIKSNFGITQSCNTNEAPTSNDNEQLFELIQSQIDSKTMELCTDKEKKEILAKNPCFNCETPNSMYCNWCEAKN